MKRFAGALYDDAAKRDSNNQVLYDGSSISRLSVVETFSSLERFFLMENGDNGAESRHRRQQRPEDVFLGEKKDLHVNNFDWSDAHGGTKALSGGRGVSVRVCVCAACKESVCMRLCVRELERSKYVCACSVY